jgi:hypothetical protein
MVHPVLEALEGRAVPAVSYHGGALLPHVEAQALYLGNQWAANPTVSAQVGYLEGFLNNIVHSSFMDALSKAGYGVGAGSFNPGRFDPVSLSPSAYLDDAAIQSYLQGEIGNRGLVSPDSNRLYVVFVEPNVAVRAGTATSVRDFVGYHGAFTGRDVNGNPTRMAYAVVAYPGGSVNNASLPWLSAAQQLTEVTSHELAEAVTDPGTSGYGWYDNAHGLEGENGDLTNGRTVFLNGYAVQRIADLQGHAMTPAGAGASRAVSFVLQGNGNLYEHAGGSSALLASGLASVSDQGIDNQGRAMVDVVTLGGAAYEYHDGAGWALLGTGVRSAKAGQGVSYLLFANGVIDEYDDATRSLSFVTSGGAKIDAGTDRYGVNAVDAIFTWGEAWEHSDSTGWHLLAANVQSVSAGAQGYAAYVTNGGTAYLFAEASNNSSFLAGNVAQLTCGTDPSGGLMLDLSYNGGATYEWRAGTGWYHVGDGVASLSKGRLGLVDVVFAGHDAYEHTLSGWRYLSGNVAVAG